MFIDNNWYGNRFIFSRYCKVKDKVALASIQHGLYLPKESLNFYKRTFQIFPWLTWSKELKKNAEKFNQKKVECVGAPFLYLHNILKKEKIKTKGTLIIPGKSSFENNEDVDFEKLIKFVKKSYPKPYTILVGYFDLERVKKIRHNYKDCIFTTCGKRGNKFFTDNLYRNINKHKIVTIFYVGTPILYSLFLKKKTFFFFNRFLKNTNSKFKSLINKKILEQNLEDKKLVNIMNKNYRLDFNNLNTKKNQKNAAKALGYDCIRKRDELKRLLGWDSKLKYLIGCFLSIIIKLKYYDVKRNF